MNFKLRLKEAYIYLSLFLLSSILVSCENNSGKDRISYNDSSSIGRQLSQYYKYRLDELIQSMGIIEDTGDRDSLLYEYNKSRDIFKALEPIMAMVESQSYVHLIGPNILKVHEEDQTDIKRSNPKGFQVIEELLTEESLDLESVHYQASYIKSRFQLMYDNTDLRHIKDYHVLWMIRDQIIRTALTGITGFDSPVLLRSLEDARISYETIYTLLELIGKNKKKERLLSEWKRHIDQVQNALTVNFEDFDRYTFFKIYVKNGLALWNETVREWSVDFPFTLALKNDLTSLFSTKTFNQTYFSGNRINEENYEILDLGKKLFYDVNLSASKAISCASCHQPEKYFTDGLVTPDGLDRNSPTLLYSGLQRAYFYDNRAGSIEGQIVSVIRNEKEFHTNLVDFQKSIEKDSAYQVQFKKAYSDGLTETNIRISIATYLRSLSYFNSKFDLNIRGELNDLTESEKNGFNLFMGKAACATCHFAPVFNGTVPVQFRESEMELIGVPATNDTLNPQIDEDPGRYNLYKTEERKFFFKTPTIRNIAETGPYMHNGVYETLEEVVDFYDKGGGIGLGIDLPYQTLPADPLELSKSEKADLIAFMKSLSDNLPSQLVN